MNDVGKALKSFLGIDYEIFDGFVTAVHDTSTCDVKVWDDDDSVLEGISLRSVADGDNNGIIAVPAIGSHVVFAKIEGESDYVLIKTSKLDKIIINVPEIIINDGANDGIVKVKELETNLNRLKEQIEAIASAIPSAMTAIGVGSAANGGNGALSFNSSMSGKVVRFEDMKNDKIKH